MIYLVTGLPGCGKTLYTIARALEIGKRDSRPVYYHGINATNLPDWTPHDPTKWMELPPRSVMIVDEAQDHYGPLVRGRERPEHFQQLAKHRHGGVDLYIITQHPSFLDTFVRRLVGVHFHAVNPFGLQRCTIHEWRRCVDDPERSGSRKDSIKHLFAYPRELFSLYQSAEVHTVKRRIPLKVLILCALPFLLLALGWGIWQLIKDPRTESLKHGAPARPGTVTPPSIGASATMPVLNPAMGLSTDQWIAMHQPRIVGMPHTAPVYDGITTPKSAPTPAGCIANDSRCVCYTHQATVIDMPDYLCRSMVKGFFASWEPPQQPAPRSPEATAAPAAAPVIAFAPSPR